jgi:hypothetical protein
MNNYTPGPWSLHYEKYITGIENDPENGCIGPVDIGHVYLRTVPGKAEANARLIVSWKHCVFTWRNLGKTLFCEAFHLTKVK